MSKTRLIRGYLSNRKQYCSINGAESELMDINIGVPQGSCLGPLLFLLYAKENNKKWAEVLVLQRCKIMELPSISN